MKWSLFRCPRKKEESSSLVWEPIVENAKDSLGFLDIIIDDLDGDHEYIWSVTWTRDDYLVYEFKIGECGSVLRTGQKLKNHACLSGTPYVSLEEGAKVLPFS